LFGRVQKEKSPHETLMETCNVLLSTIQSYKDSVAALDSSISKFSDKMDLVTQQLKQANSDDMFGKQELKSEIQSVKGILLSSSLDVHSPYNSFYGRNPFKRDQASSEFLVFQ